MSLAHALATAVAAIALGGCWATHVYDAVLRPEPRAGGSRGPVELYLGAQRPTRAFYDVGLVQAVGFGDDATAGDIAYALRARGQQLGCDAVVNASVDVGASLAHGYGVCVRYVTGAPPRNVHVPAAPPPASELAPTGEPNEPLPL